MDKLIQDLHSSLIIFRYHHLLTTSKAVHDACEFYYTTMGNQLDSLAECYIGSGSPVKMPKFIEIEVLTTEKCLQRLLIDIEDLLPNQISEFQSLLDDIKNTINKTNYLIELE